MMAKQKTLHQLGYEFNKAGKLYKLPTPYMFRVSNNDDECWQHYHEVADAMTEELYKILETQEKFHRLKIPIDAKPDQPSTFVFASEHYEQQDTLLLLVPGSGNVRPGQWARKIIMEQGLDKGSQIPYIKKAKAKGYGVLIMNTNDNYTNGGEVEESYSPSAHGEYVWNNYVGKTKATKIIIATHSEGALVVNRLANILKKDFESRVKAVAYIDSVMEFANESVFAFLKLVSRLWSNSLKPLDTLIQSEIDTIFTVSAGQQLHAMTPYSSMNSIFEFFDTMLKKDCEESEDCALGEKETTL